MGLIDLHAFDDAPLVREPFRFAVVRGFLKSTALPSVQADFPDIHDPGLLPVCRLDSGPAFEALIEEIRSAPVTEMFSEKFGIDLSGRPMMITVRGRCREKDGQIHTDSETKLVSGLLYLNDRWAESGGRLRFLRSPYDLDASIVEVPPDGGTLVAFRRSPLSWHGHEPFVGERRYVMFNWMTDEAAVERELARHRLSARMKRFVPRTHRWKRRFYGNHAALRQ